MNIAQALKWSFLAELAPRVVSPGIFIVLARLLAPEDFGVMAAATVVISFSQIFWEAGMGKALIQYQGDRAAAADAAFWINNSLACVVAAVLIASAERLAAVVFQDPRVADVLRVLALQVVLAALVSVPSALLQKDMAFRQLFRVRLTTVAIPGLIAIPLAWYGLGHWALVAGTLAGQLGQALVLWRLSPWRPRWAFDRHTARNVLGFGSWVGLSGLLSWFYVWADSLIVGMYLGSRELGLFQTGNQLVMMIFALLFTPVSPVLYSHLSSMGGDRKHVAEAMTRVVRILILTAIPVAIILFSLSGPVAAVIFGDRWQGIGLVIGVMALMHGFSWVVGMNREAYQAMGKPSYEAIVTGSTLVIYLAAYLISIRYGLEAFVWTRLALALGALLLHLLVLRRLVPVDIAMVGRQLLAVAGVSAIISLSLAMALGSGVINPWQQVLLGFILGPSLVAAALYLIWGNEAWRDVAELIQSRFR